MKNKTSFKILITLLIMLGIFFIYAHRMIISIFSGRVSFPEKNINRVLAMDDEQNFTLLRTLHLENTGNGRDGYAVFIVRFKFKGLSFDANKRLSIIPAPFLMNMDGFIEKDWTFNNETGEFQGIYQWESENLASNYPDSFVFKLMTKRAAPRTVTYKILPNTDLNQYLKQRYTK